VQEFPGRLLKYDTIIIVDSDGEGYQKVVALADAGLMQERVCKWIFKL